MRHEPADEQNTSAGSPYEERYATCYYRVLCPAKVLYLNWRECCIIQAANKRERDSYHLVSAVSKASSLRPLRSGDRSCMRICRKWCLMDWNI